MLAMVAIFLHGSWLMNCAITLKLNPLNKGRQMWYVDVAVILLLPSMMAVAWLFWQANPSRF